MTRSGRRRGTGRPRAAGGPPREAIVVGAGPSGLATAGMLERAGIATRVLERTDRLAAPWHEHYDGLRLQSPSWMSHLPGYRFARGDGVWVTRERYIEYLERYVRDRGLNVELGVEVQRIDPEHGGWRLSTSEGELVTPVVIVATGYTHVPLIPSWPGAETYRGRIVHSHSYRDRAQVSGEDVLVVGTGNSGAEIAYQVAESDARRVRLAVRTPPHIVPRAILGVPTLLAAALVEQLPRPLVPAADAVTAATMRLFVPDLSRHGLPKPTRGMYRQYLDTKVTPIIDTGFIGAMRGGRIEPVAAVAGFEDGQVRLSDGSRIDPSLVIAATGFRCGLEPLVGHLGALRADGEPVVDGEDACPGAPGLYFIGYSRPFSGNLRRLRRDAPALARAVAHYLGRRDPHTVQLARTRGAACEPPVLQTSANGERGVTPP